MPARTRPLKATDGPLARFALELRRLRDHAPADRLTSVDKLVHDRSHRVSRAAIYSALSGRTLPSRETLKIMVLTWSPAGAVDLAAWNERRSQCERELALRHRPSPVRVEGGGAGDTAETTATPAAQSAFGAEFRRLRTRAGLSLSETSSRIHYSKGYLSKVENGDKPPNFTLVRAADEALNANGALLRIFLRDA